MPDTIPEFGAVEATRPVAMGGVAASGRGDIGAPSDCDWILEVRTAGAAGISPSSGKLPVALGSLEMLEAKGFPKGSPNRDASVEHPAALPPITPMSAKRDSVLNPRPVPRTRIDAPVCLTQLDDVIQTGFRLNNRSRSPRFRHRRNFPRAGVPWPGQVRMALGSDKIVSDQRFGISPRRPCFFLRRREGFRQRMNALPSVRGASLNPLPNPSLMRPSRSRSMKASRLPVP